MNRFFTFSFLLLFSKLILAQVVTTEPAIFTDQDEVVITFHAELGSAGLKDYTGDIYAHTGLITSESTAGSDWKYVIAGWSENTSKAKLTKVSDNTYTLTIAGSVREFYGVSDNNELIEKLAFVFRNSDGSKTGKDNGGADIFVDVSEPGLDVKINTPVKNAIYEIDETIDISASAQENETMELFIDDVSVKSITGSELSYSLSPGESKVIEVKIKASSATETVLDSLTVYVKGSVPLLDLPKGSRKGIEYLSETAARLVLFAPYKEMVFVLGDFNNWSIDENYLMNRDGSTFWLEINDLIPGKEYAFQYFIDGELYIADPYSGKIADPSNDKYIPEQTYPDLYEYPSQNASGIATIIQTEQEEYNWEITNYEVPKTTDLVIYELLIRDFTEGPDGKEGNINGVIEKLDYLDSLGVNAIEFMPFNEFEGNNSWGYNPSFYFAPDKAYGTANDYKRLIDSIHARGMIVIQDMVLNHSYSQSPLVQMYFENGNPAANNPWYNVTSPNTSYSWGYDFDHESQYTKEFIDSVNSYWLTEYKIDGFRFDFTKGFTNTSGDGWAYDASRIAILKRMYNSIKEVNPEALVILEHLADNSEEKELANAGMLLWGNLNHTFNEATMGYNESGKSDFSSISYKNRNWNDPHLVAYAESHDEERLMFKNIEYGNSSGNYNIKDLNTGLKRNEMAAVFMLSVPGPKMIWQFGELGYDYSIDYNGRVGNKPVRWDYLDNEYRVRLYQIYAEMNKLRIAEDAFETTDFELSLGGALKSIKLYHDDMNVILIGNFDVVQKTYSVTFPETGVWYDYFYGEEFDVATETVDIILQPGEYRLYTTKQFEYPGIETSVSDLNEYNSNLNVYPNPSSGGFYFDVENGGLVEIYDLNGQKIDAFLAEKNAAIYWEGKDGQTLKNGIYIARIINNTEVRSIKILRH